MNFHSNPAGVRGGAGHPVADRPGSRPLFAGAIFMQDMGCRLSAVGCRSRFWRGRNAAMDATQIETRFQGIV
jgi:hypothetical protein